MLDSVVERILLTLSKNKFPGNKVRLSKESIEDLCEENDVSMEEVFSELKNKQVETEIQEDKIVFSALLTGNIFDSSLFEQIEGLEQADIMEMAQNIMKNITPEQMSEIQKQYTELDHDKKEDIMKKIKGVFPPK